MSTRLDLDFQDYSPTSTGGSRISNKKPEVQVKIPQTNNNKASIQAILGSLQNLQSGPTSGGLSDETLQQLLWLSGKEWTKQQRGANNKNGNWILSYMAQYFDTTTDDVIQRMLWSTIPIRKKGIDLDTIYDAELSRPHAPTNSNVGQTNDGDTLSLNPVDESGSGLIEQLNSKRRYYSYMERFIQSRPDFYGPFWLSTTLVFAVAIFSNILSFAHHRSKMYQVGLLESKALLSDNSSRIDLSSITSQAEEWHYSMDEMSTMTSVVMLYVLVAPSLLWFIFWFQGCNNYYTLTEIICAYGYSLSIFIPLTVLFMIENPLFRYITLTIAGLASGMVLTMSFYPVINSHQDKGGSKVILMIVPVLNIALAFTLHKIMSQ